MGGPHKLRECLPMAVLLRNRLKYALTYKEVKLITMQRHIKVDSKVRTDITYPCGFMDVVTIEKTNQHFRLLYDTKGRFVLHAIHKDEAAYKLCRVQKVAFGPGGNPYVATHDGRTIRFPDPEIKVHDTVLVNVKDAAGHSYATRLQNVMVIGDVGKEWVSLPKGKGIKLSNLEDRAARMKK